uniref:Uncharacterized protein n=2 Tax=Aegilops tauschii subsp. strangulata TaxID=200361 RepID=A0A453T2D3_AEGTS
LHATTTKDHAQASRVTSHHWLAPQLRQSDRSHKLFLGSLERGSRAAAVGSARAAASMGLDVAEISELAALQPIQTAVGGARGTGGPMADDGAPAADTGCVTPKASMASGSMAMLPIAPLQQDDGIDVGFATPLATATGGEIGPRDGCGAGANAGDEGSFTTPTTADSALVPATVCPPAPRKSAPVPTRKRAPLQQRLFFYPVPHDLTTVFVAVPQRPPPAKKMRAHMVESSVPT